MQAAKPRVRYIILHSPNTIKLTLQMRIQILRMRIQILSPDLLFCSLGDLRLRRHPRPCTRLSRKRHASEPALAVRLSLAAVRLSMCGFDGVVTQSAVRSLQKARRCSGFPLLCSGFPLRRVMGRGLTPGARWHCPNTRLHFEFGIHFHFDLRFCFDTGFGSEARCRSHC